MDDNIYRYYGEVRDGKPHGLGFIQSTDGSQKSCYGLFSSGQLHGYAECINQLKDIVYKGDFVSGKFHGKGHYRYQNVSYTGDFDKGQFHGHGRLKVNLYEGAQLFVRGGQMYTGFAENYENYKQYPYSFEVEYIGYFQNGQYHGRGSLSYATEKNAEKKYDGNFLRGQRSGQGVLKYSNPASVYEYVTYTGGWFKDKTQGDNAEIFYLKKNGTGRRLNTSGWEEGCYDAYFIDRPWGFFDMRIEVPYCSSGSGFHLIIP